MTSPKLDQLRSSVGLKRKQVMKLTEDLLDEAMWAQSFSDRVKLLDEFIRKVRPLVDRRKP